MHRHGSVSWQKTQQKRSTDQQRRQTRQTLAWKRFTRDGPDGRGDTWTTACVCFTAFVELHSTAVTAKLEQTVKKKDSQ